MKISKLQKFAGIFFALALGTSTLFAQGMRNGNRTLVQNNEKVSCLNSISGLTDEQVTAITKMENEHQEQMDAMRDKRRATTNLSEKNQIREEMLNNVVDHRSEVRNLLNEDQQKQYDLFQLRGKNSKNQRGTLQGRGNGSGQGFARGNGAGRGAGNGRGNGKNMGNCPRFN